MSKFMTKSEVKELIKMTKKENSTIVEIYEWTLKPVLKTKLKETEINSTDSAIIEKEINLILKQLDYKILDID